MSKHHPKYDRLDSGLIVHSPDVWIPRERGRVDNRRFMSRRRCCCGEEACGGCVDGTQPNEILLTLSGYSGTDSCGYGDFCDSLNGDIILANLSLGEYTCGWMLWGTDAPGCRSLNRITLTIEAAVDFSSYTILCELDFIDIFGDSFTNRFQKTVYEKPDCSMFDGEVLPYLASAWEDGSYSCANIAVTATITSL